MSLLKQIKKDSLLTFNISSNLLSNMWVALVTFASIPILYRELSSAGYAIIGMYILVSQWVAFLDVGLGAALARYVAASRNSFQGMASACYLKHQFERLSLFIILLSALFFLFGLLFFKEALSYNASENVFILFAISICLRIQSNLYKSGLMGLEKQVYVSIVNMASISIRFGLPVVLAFFAELSLSMFFSVQLITTVGELFVQKFLLDHFLGRNQKKMNWKEVTTQVKFGFSVAGLSVVWIAFSQFDKIILSSILPLALFGEIMLVVQLSSAVLLIGAPIQAAILPRLTSMIASADTVNATELYVNASVIFFSIGSAASFAIAIAAEPVLNYISGSTARNRDLELMILFYCLGNVLVVIMSLSYALQNAAGNLRIHWIGSIIFLIIQIPFVYIVAKLQFLVYLPIVYLIFGTLYLFCWLYFAHSRLLSIAHGEWVFQVFFRSVLTSASVGFCSIFLSKWVLLGYPATQMIFSILVFFLIVFISLRKNSVFNSFFQFG